MRFRPTIIIVTIALAGWIGYWLAGTAVPNSPVRQDSAGTESGPKRTVIVDDPAPRFRRGERVPTSRRDDEALDAGALPGQRNLIFENQAALEDFLKRAGNRVRIMGRLDALNALRVGFLNADDLAFLMDGGTQASFVYPVDIPASPDGTAQARSRGAGGPDCSIGLAYPATIRRGGRGVTVAMLDTGVTANSAFSSRISGINLVDLPADPATQSGHGTAVASMIIGNGSLTPGVAPGASVISVRIANDLGQSDSFLLAQGIVAAVDAGARLINISVRQSG